MVTGIQLTPTGKCSDTVGDTFPPQLPGKPGVLYTNKHRGSYLELPIAINTIGGYKWEVHTKGTTVIYCIPSILQLLLPILRGAIIAILRHLLSLAFTHSTRYNTTLLQFYFHQGLRV